MTTTLKITDGTTTLNLVWNSSTNTNYQLIRDDWTPQIPALPNDFLSGEGVYDRAIEDIGVNVWGTTAAVAMANLTSLNLLLDQADRWWRRNQSVSAVTLRYSPTGATVSSAASPLIAVVLGRPEGDTVSGVGLSPTFNSRLNAYQIENVRIRVLRRGTWTGASDNTGASGAAANCTVITQTFGGTHPISSPVDIELGGFNKTTTPTIKAGFLCIGSGSSDVQVVEAESGTVAGYTSVADAAPLARGGSVLRYTPGGTTAVTSGNITGLATLTSNTPIAIIAAVRNNSGTTTFLMRANLTGLGGTFSTPEILIDVSTTQPRLVLLGTLIGKQLITPNATLTITASAASGTIDIDYLIVVQLRNETCTVIAHDDIVLTNLVTAGAATLDFLFNPTNDRVPYATVLGTGGASGAVPVSYRGPLPILSSGQNLYALWVATNGIYWRFTDTANAIVNITLNCGRYRQHLTPQ